MHTTSLRTSPPAAARPTHLWQCRTPGELLDVGLGMGFGLASSMAMLPLRVLGLQGLVRPAHPAAPGRAGAPADPQRLEAAERIAQLDAVLLDCEHKERACEARLELLMQRAGQIGAGKEPELQRLWEEKRSLDARLAALEQQRQQARQVRDHLALLVERTEHRADIDEAAELLRSLGAQVEADAERNDRIEQVLLEDRALHAAPNERSATEQAEFERFKASLAPALPELPPVRKPVAA